ncbi:KRI1-like family C-terminal-domain-containing protein [Biscogniauxia marginata]|nr:KRI1-like family C-terminal-domain-containing protein [Biscogniauxia marginata]
MASTENRKKALFDDSDDDSDGGVTLTVNSEYARRFEHNKKREELHRLEEKYKTKQSNGDKSKDDGSESDSSSDDETEDEDGFLATEELDAQISATLQAIKNKDPRVYDGKTTFYTPVDENADASSTASKPKKEKPVFLQDYHREKILRGDTGADFDQKEPPQTYVQEQDSLKKSIREEIQVQLQAGDGDEESDADEDFLKAKKKTRATPENGIHPSRAERVKVPKPDITDADKDPELFLSNFLASRAWVEEGANKWQAFESDEEEDPDKADEWEAAYNLRFEDPSKSNEVLKSYARDVTAARSVRREEKSGRKLKRELERERKEAERQERREERARLRRLKVDEAENKLQKIKKAAGLSGKTLKDEEWQRLLDDAWENDKWEEEMNKAFNNQYYAEADEGFDEENEGAAVNSSKKTEKIKKPKWDDDIDIKDLVPDFDDEERPNVTLTDHEEVEEDDDDDDDDDDAPTAKRQKTTKERKKERLASQKAARQERAKLEALVDARMEIEDPEILVTGPSKKDGQPRFAYRETRPESFGLTTRDILMASDADLNSYAGLKKLAHFRDADKQKRDHKKLGKKARLRQWRKETFGPEFEREPPAFNPGDEPLAHVAAEESGNIVEGGSKKKRKRSRGNKKGKGTATTTTTTAT